ncbi:MAG: type II secretion system F family protein, partial [Alphaproteobacteria bacterium]
TIGMMIEQAGLSISLAQYWIFSVLSMCALVGVAKAMEKGPGVLAAAAVIGLLGLPRFVLKKLAAKRQKHFLEEFPDALEATVRLLKAGMPVAEAVAMIAREYEGPVGEEMGRIYDKQKIGIPMHEAAFEATKRMPLTEMQMFATGLAIQAQTGSSLSEVLMNLSGVIRSRFRLKRKVKALSSEAIASASIIAALPILVGLALYFVKYEYISVMFTDPTGKMLMTAAVCWMGVGVFAMKQMINFKI